jgi:mannose-1-phosphate guanylyltransferase
MLVLPADHVVAPLGKYLSDMQLGLALAYRERRLVTFGIPPTHPETGYGYLREGASIGAPWSRSRVRKVAAFHEKPTAARARKFLAGGFYWNSGMFAWRADVIREEIASHLPALASALEKLDRTRKGSSIPRRALAAAYPKLEAISIDHGVMEKSSRVAMVIASFGWNDIGSWDAVGDLWPRDTAGNASRDPLIAIDARNNVVASRAKPVALLGVSNLAVVDAGDALLICPRERAQEVRAVVAGLERAKLGQPR